MGDTLERLEKTPRTLAGVDFNLASPKQLGELLFNTLGLDRKNPGVPKPATAPMPRCWKNWKAITRWCRWCSNTACSASSRAPTWMLCPSLWKQETGRVHTDFNQAVTATGRLSSSNPNLQNIPVRTEYSRRIRKAFLPQENWRLLSADYSQIELRILTHLSGEEVLQQAYRDGDDVHALTARLLLDKDTVSADERRLGKTINFGVIYGMGAQRLPVKPA